MMLYADESTCLVMLLLLLRRTTVRLLPGEEEEANLDRVPKEEFPEAWDRAVWGDLERDRVLDGERRIRLAIGLLATVD